MDAPRRPLETSIKAILHVHESPKKDKVILSEFDLIEAIAGVNVELIP
jgi:hypothetical protein